MLLNPFIKVLCKSCIILAKLFASYDINVIQKKEGFALYLVTPTGFKPVTF